MCAKSRVSSTALMFTLLIGAGSVFAQNENKEPDFQKQWRDTKKSYDEGNHSDACARWMIMSYSGIPDGAHATANCYLDGKAVPQSFDMAAKYFECAAIQGYFRSQVALAMLIFESKVNPPGDRDAYFWFSIAAANADAPPEGKSAAAAMRDAAAKQMKPEQIRKVQLLTSRWKAGPNSSCFFK